VLNGFQALAQETRVSMPDLNVVLLCWAQHNQDYVVFVVMLCR
jgi:hypothetical protein